MSWPRRDGIVSSLALVGRQPRDRLRTYSSCRRNRTSRFFEGMIRHVVYTSILQLKSVAPNIAPQVSASVSLALTPPTIFLVRTAVCVTLIGRDTTKRAAEPEKDGTFAVDPAAIVQAGEKFLVRVGRLRGKGCSRVVECSPRRHGDRIALVLFICHHLGPSVRRIDLSTGRTSRQDRATEPFPVFVETIRTRTDGREQVSTTCRGQQGCRKPVERCAQDVFEVTLQRSDYRVRLVRRHVQRRRISDRRTKSESVYKRARECGCRRDHGR